MLDFKDMNVTLIRNKCPNCGTDADGLSLMLNSRIIDIGVVITCRKCRQEFVDVTQRKKGISFEDVLKGDA